MGFLKYIIIGVVALIAISIVALSTAKSVPEGHVGILLTSGSADKQYVPPGLKFITPFYQDVINFNTQNIKTDVDIAAASKDLQAVSGVIAVNTRVMPDVAVKIYSTIGTGYQTTVINPAVQESVKQITAKYTAGELLSKRDIVKNEILQLVKTRLANSDITLLDLSIINFDFSRSFNEAIEAKATEAQLAEKAKNVELRLKIEANQTVAKAEGEQRAAIANANAIKQQQILQAEGEAQSIILKANATKIQKDLAYKAEAEGINLIQEQLKKNPQYIEYIKANKWSGNLPTTLIDSNGTSMLLSVVPQ